MPSTRLLALAVLSLTTFPLSGCGYSPRAGWPAGTEAVVLDSDAWSVIARVPRDQQNKIPRDSLMVGSQTPVVIVDDPVLRAANAGAGRVTSPMDPIRVRIVNSPRRIEVFMRRGELVARRVAEQSAISFIRAAILPLFTAAGVLWTIESLVLFCLRMRSGRMGLQLGPLPLQTLASVILRARRRSPLNERTDEECERWREWISERTARRKAICAHLRTRRLEKRSRAG
jgi:hypothetical protein